MGLSRIIGPIASFNGATASLPWNPGQARQVRSELRCFNGATASLPWNPTSSRPNFAMNFTLQWGHGISAVESGVSVRRMRIFSRASMGPRHLCRGIRRNPSSLRTERFASMGPRHLCRGIFDGGSCLSRARSWLQWGHGISAVESTMPVPAALLISSLQWGHGISAVESQCAGRPNALEGSASMGPRHLCRGIVKSVTIPARVKFASMGPRHLCRGIVKSVTIPARVKFASMGPRHLCRGILLQGVPHFR